MSGEFELIKKLASGWSSGPEAAIGPGDDASAVAFSTDQETLLLQTTDLLIEGIHFQKGWGCPFQLGWKSLAVNLSDIAAMGGKPLHTHLSLAIPSHWSEAEILELRDGFKACAERFQIRLLGGDLSRSKDSLMIAGMADGIVPSDQVIRRGGAKPGDVVWVSGPLGGASAGLQLLKEGTSDDQFKDLYEAFLEPQPEVELGMLCASSGLVNALIDLSDGLAGDLGHIMEASKAGAILEEAKIPFPELLRETAAEKSWDLLDLILRGGEDYRLLGCTPQARFDRFRRLVEETLGTSVIAVGLISAQPGLRLKRRDGGEEAISPTAHDHFSDIK